MSTQHGGERGEERVRSGALFEESEEYWQLPRQEESVRGWQEAAVEEEGVDGIHFIC